MSNMEKWLNTLIDSFMTKYRGCNIVDRDGGFYWVDKRYDSVQDAKDAIDRTYELIGTNQPPPNRLKK
jgi:hypothetical protein